MTAPTQSAPLDPAAVEELRTLCGNVSGHRWEAEEGLDVMRIHAGVYAQFGGKYPDAPRGQAPLLIARCQDTRDARFIAAARNALPTLLDEVERLRAVLTEISKRPADCGPDCNCNAARALEKP